jgi:UDP-3-O-[3-hydroxymyristoyl] glucosamine N-acyltransferase
MMLRDIAAALGATYTGDGGIEIAALAQPAHASGDDLALAMTRDSAAALTTSKARAAVVSRECTAPLDRLQGVITVEHPRLALATLTALFERPAELAPGIHPTAVVAPDAILAEGVRIGPLVVVGARTSIGRGTMIHAHVTVGADVMIGCDGLIHPGARIGDRVRIGDRTIIHNNASIGADGFSFATALQSGEPVRIHSLGTVILEDDVEVGANSAIDRATVAVTRIGRNTKIDNLVQVGHNVEIGESCRICGMVGISGSVKIGDRAVIGGGAGIADHVTIGAEAVVMAASGVGRDVPPKTAVFGTPAVPRERAFEQLRLVGRLRTMFAEVRELRRRADERDQAAKPKD